MYGIDSLSSRSFEWLTPQGVRDDDSKVDGIFVFCRPWRIGWAWPSPDLDICF
jgi:hypothetical protein